MGIKLANNAFGTLAAGIASDATSITLTTGHGDRFPFLGTGDYFYATLIDTSNNLEIVKCTARSTDVLTVTRAQEGTTARAYSAGDRVEIRLTAQTFSDAVDDTAYVRSVNGTAPDANGNVDVTDYVRSVNGTAPDANGNVAVPTLSAALYTSSGTWTVPAGVTTAEVEVVGGGGASGNTYTSAYGGYGGSGAWITAVVSGLTPGAVITVTVGLGGAGTSGNGGSGGTSSFGGYVTCTGGAGGTSGNLGGHHGANGTVSVSATAVAIGRPGEWAHEASTTSTAKEYTPLSGYAAGYGANSPVPTGSSGAGPGGYGGVGGKILVKW